MSDSDFWKGTLMHALFSADGRAPKAVAFEMARRIEAADFGDYRVPNPGCVASDETRGLWGSFLVFGGDTPDPDEAMNMVLAVTPASVTVKFIFYVDRWSGSTCPEAKADEDRFYGPCSRAGEGEVGRAAA